MGTVIPIGTVGPEFRVFVDAKTELNLGDVSRFLQRVDTAARRVAYAKGSSSPRIDIVSLSAGSPLDTKLKLQESRRGRAALAISAATLALGVATYLRDDPAAARASRDIIAGGNAQVIIVEGGGVRETIRLQDLDAADERAVAASASPKTELLSGPQEGFVTEINGEPWVELDSHPGLFVRIRDERGAAPPLKPHARYTLDGEAHISHRPREESFFVLRNAFLLE